MSLASNALIDLAYYKAIIQVADDAVSYPDEVMESMINQASQIIETECRRKFITPATAINEIFNGNGNKDYYVRNGRIVETPTIKYWSGTDFVATTSTFDYNVDNGRVYFTDGSIFSLGRDNWQITYKYGWTLSTLPVNIKLACAGLVSHINLMMRKMNVVSESFGDVSVSYDWSGKNSMIQQIINEYKMAIYG